MFSRNMAPPWCSFCFRYFSIIVMWRWSCCDVWVCRRKLKWESWRGKKRNVKQL